MVFCFSGTGNTRWAAEELSKTTGEELIDIGKEIYGNCTYQLKENESIGFCFPVHGWRPPKIVRAFIEKMHIEMTDNNPYCWALCTAGDDIGLTMEYLNRDLKQQSLKAESMFSLIMPESYIGLPFMDVDKPEKERAKKDAAREQLETVKKIIINRERGVTMTYKGHWPRINSHVLGAAFVKWLVNDRPFRVNLDKCLRCGTCAEVCPIENIEWKQGEEPVWQHDPLCTTCFACYHHCPVHAIEYGHRTKHKGQYFFKK